MTPTDIAALMKGVAPALRDMVEGTVSPLLSRIAELERQLADLSARPEPEPIDTSIFATREETDAIRRVVDALPAPEPLPDIPAIVRQEVSEVVAAIEIPAPQDGKSVTVDDCRPLIEESVSRAVSEAVARIPAAKDGVGITDAVIDRSGALVLTKSDGGKIELGVVVGRDGADGRDGEDGAPGKDGEPGERGEPGRDGKDGADGAPGEKGADGAPGRDGIDGKSVDRSEVEGMVREIATEILDAWPKPKDGKDGEPGPKGEKGDPGEPGKDGIDGRDGADGLLPLAKEWDGAVAYRGEVRTHNGALWQARADTGREPGHDDWICLAAAGKPGKDADQIDVRGTYDADGEYKRLNIVALNGGAFIARKDDPGACPGEGWQVIAMRGKPGQPGEQGKRGEPGLRGLPGPGISSIEVDNSQGVLTVTNGDGTVVTCDLYELLRKIAK